MPDSRFRVAACDYNAEGTHIDVVMVHYMDEWKPRTRKWLRDKVELGEKFWTWVDKGEWVFDWGAEIVPDGEFFVTTKPNESTKDNLGDLPSIAKCEFNSGGREYTVNEAVRRYRLTGQT